MNNVIENTAKEVKNTQKEAAKTYNGLNRREMIKAVVEKGLVANSKEAFSKKTEELIQLLSKGDKLEEIRNQEHIQAVLNDSSMSRKEQYTELYNFGLTFQQVAALVGKSPTYVRGNIVGRFDKKHFEHSFEYKGVAFGIKGYYFNELDKSEEIQAAWDAFAGNLTDKFLQLSEREQKSEVKKALPYYVGAVSYEARLIG